MTQNDIAYYNARKDAKNMRLQRRETKRHNLASEEASKLNAQASMVGAQARVASAQASQQQANTAEKRFQLEWESEYGLPYGTDPQEYYYPTDKTLDLENEQRSHAQIFSQRFIEVVPGSGIYVPRKMHTASYSKGATQAARDTISAQAGQAGIVETVFDIGNTAAGTVRILQQTTKIGEK